jgi:hypothetical protein
MTVLARFPAFRGYAVAITLLFMLAMSAAFAASPENSRKSEYGTGWQCNPGFREVNLRCIKVVVPANAYNTN